MEYVPLLLMFVFFAFNVPIAVSMGAAALAYIWGPYDVASKAAAMQESEHGESGEREHDD